MNEWFNIDDCKMIQYNRIVRTFWRTRKCSGEVLWRWPKICPRGGTLPLLVVAKYTVCASKHLRIVSFNGKSDFIIFTRTRESRQELRKFMRNIKKSNPERGWVVNSLSLDKIRCFVWNCGCFLCLLFCFLCLLFCFCVYFLFFVSIIFLIGFIILLLVSSIFFFVSIMLLFVSIILLLCLLFCFLCLLFWFQGNSFALWGHHFAFTCFQWKCFNFPKSRCFLEYDRLYVDHKCYIWNDVLGQGIWTNHNKIKSEQKNDMKLQKVVEMSESERALDNKLPSRQV